MHRKAGHTKASGNFVFAQHRISRQPQSQALGQNLRLFDGRFRHEDDEFIAAVSRHNI